MKGHKFTDISRGSGAASPVPGLSYVGLRFFLKVTAKDSACLAEPTRVLPVLKLLPFTALTKDSGGISTPVSVALFVHFQLIFTISEPLNNIKSDHSQEREVFPVNISTPGVCCRWMLKARSTENDKILNKSNSSILCTLNENLHENEEMKAYCLI